MNTKKKSDELTLAIQAARLYQQAVDELIDDLVRSKVDMRIIKEKTRQTMLVAVSKYDELVRLKELTKAALELTEAKCLKPVKEKH